MTCSRSSHIDEHFGPEWRAKTFPSPGCLHKAAEIELTN